MKYCDRRVDVDAEVEETVVEAILEELAREIHAAVGVRMHRLGVCEWEVKLWMESSGQANGAWRVVVTNVTGHTCTVHVRLLFKKMIPPNHTLLDSFWVCKRRQNSGPMAPYPNDVLVCTINLV